MKAQFKLPRQVRLAFIGKDYGLYLKEAVKCTPENSFCCSLSLAGFMAQNYSNIFPPNFKEQLSQKQLKQFEENKDKAQLSYEPWADYLSSLHWKQQRGWVTKESEINFYACKVTEDYLMKFEGYESYFVKIAANEQKKEVISQSFYQKSQKTRKIGIINFVANQIQPHPFIPKSNIISLYEGLWFGSEDIWKRYDILKKQFPSEDDLNNFDAFLLTGSGNSVNDNILEVKEIYEKLLEGLKNNPKLRIVGICFGHQGIARHYGGEVAKLQFINGIQKVVFDKVELQKYPILHSLKQFDYYLMSQYHSDHITKVPKRFQVFGKSQSCLNQSMISDDGRILGLQFHPEYSFGYQKGLAKRINLFMKDGNKSDRGKFYREQYSNQEGLNHHHRSIQIVRIMVRNYIEADVNNLKSQEKLQ